MAQPLIKFFRVATLPAKGVPGALYFVSSEGVLYVCTGETSFEAYAGIKTAALNGSVLTLTPSVGAAISVDIAALAQAAVDLSEYAKTEAVNTAISNAIAAEVERANGAYDEKGAAAAALVAAKEYADGLPHENTTYTFAEGTVNGEFVVTPSGGTAQQVKVHGLGSAAYTESTAYDEAGAAEAVKTALVNGETEFADFKAVGDELRALDLAAAAKVADVTVGGTSVVNTNHVAVLGTAAGKAIEDFDAAGAAATALADAKKYTDEAKVAVIGDATTAGDTLGKLEDRIETIVANEKTYSIAKVTEGLGGNVKEAYKLVDEDGTQCGTLIEIEKDDSLVDVVTTTDAKGNQVVKFTYNLADGTSKEVTIDLSAYVTESEYGDGLQVIDHVISVKRDETSEAFLSVSEDGVKLSGVQTAINTAKNEAIAAIAPAIEALDAEVTSTDGAKVTVKVTEVDGKITAVSVTESDIASAKEVEENAQVTAAALNDLNDRLAGLKTGVSSISGDDTDYVNVSAAAADDKGNVALTVTVDKVEATDKTKYASNGLATDGYVKEQVATVAATADTAVQKITSKDSTIQVTRAENSNDVNLELVWASF